MGGRARQGAGAALAALVVAALTAGCGGSAPATAGAPAVATGRAAAAGAVGRGVVDGAVTGSPMGAATPSTGTGTTTSPTAEPSTTEPATTTRPTTRPAAPRPPAPPTAVSLKPLRSGAGTSFTATVRHRAGEEFGTGTVRLWLPDHVGAVRGVMVGGFFPGQPAADPRPDRDVEQLALEYHLAVVTQAYTHLDGTRDRREAYCDHGSARGMARGLTTIAGQARHREIASAPLVVYYGYSLAGLCAKGIAETFPSRTAVLVYGGMSRVDCSIPGVASIPTLIYGGGADGFVMNIPNEIPQCRAKGMPIAVALKPGAGHGGVRGTAGFRNAFLDAVLAERLPLRAGGPLRRLDLATGYLADNGTHATRPFAAYTGARARASWLPSAAAAAAWKAWTTG